MRGVRKVMGGAASALVALVLVPVGSGVARASASPVPPACYNPVASWPLADRVEQLLMVSGRFSDLSASADAASAGVGALVLFGQPPAGSGPSIASGLRALQAQAGSTGHVALWMSTDEEGGTVARLADVIGALPSARQMAAQWSPAQTQAALAAHAGAMRSLGVNMDLAPVLDVSPPGNPVADEADRSFSAAPGTVTSYGRAFWSGLEQGGVVPVAKHFPGLGHASADTDQGPSTDPPLSQLQADDLIPFADSIGHGVPVVMVGHPSVPGLTGSAPASLSPAAYHYLRATLHFGGVAITDSLDAKAIPAAGWSEPGAAAQAIESGADMAMVGSASWPASVQALLSAVGSGSLPVSTVDSDVTLILRAKGVPPCPVVGLASTPAPGSNGYRLAGSGGGVASFGVATPDEGSIHGTHLQQPVVGMAATPTGR
ncbi:MAG TPA: glycoside hydrolase family 3 N-terminal domain-containing protein, partial [Acidimicrobiales bacterium]|nr:glycoside hydrolase family 3 N-terminal domain-containing protein [Acidimicrobiales bacterium]